MNRPASRPLLLLAWLILVLGAVRAGSLVLAEPVAGYANQFDMLRTSACLGLWPVTADGVERGQATPQAPLPQYALGEQDAFNCLPGSESLLAGIAITLSFPFSDPDIDLRWVGGFKLALLLLAGFMLQRAFSAHSGAALLHAVIFSLVLCDPFNMLFANGLYTEFSAMLGFYLALGSVMAACFKPAFPGHLLCFWFAGLLLLGGSRMQHLLLPVVLLLPAWFVMRSRSPRAWWLSLLLALGVAGGQIGLQRSSEAIGDANVVNTLFFSVLPAAEEPASLASELGLDPPCADLAHTSWYLARGENHRALCPQAFELSRGRLLAVLFAQPRTFATLVFRALHQSGGWRLSYVGEVAGQDYGRVGGLRGASLAGIVAAMSFSVYAVFYALPLWPGAWTAWRLARYGSLLTPARLALGVGFFGLALVMVVVFGTALIGDGFSEFSRHAHLAHNAALMAWFMTPVALVRLARVYGRRALSVPLAGYAALSVGVWLTARALPLASGVADLPGSVYLQPGKVTLQGWVADPYGVAALRAESSDGRNWPLAFGPSAAVADYLPVGGEPVRFDQVIDTSGVPAGGMLRFVVVNGNGVETVFERRYFR